ncbi:hypothetical protein PANT111_560040 [Pantoea brenneri]|uniref:Uncharacterized protein n=1 Tax=Pantoea brenneri TaxID=472694 RepID=A0AAX3JC33_9GAMM|nr:hypothetical protein PANT111_560040 [Pantoea brenneri]
MCEVGRRQAAVAEPVQIIAIPAPFLKCNVLTAIRSNDRLTGYVLVVNVNDGQRIHAVSANGLIDSPACIPAALCFYQGIDVCFFDIGVVAVTIVAPERGITAYRISGTDHVKAVSHQASPLSRLKAITTWFTASTTAANCALLTLVPGWSLAISASKALMSNGWLRLRDLAVPVMRNIPVVNFNQQFITF